VTQETDQSYGPFQSAVHTNLQLINDERIAADRPKSLSPWIVGLVVFGGKELEKGLIVGSAFQLGFSHEQNIKAWENVGAVKSWNSPTQPEVPLKPEGPLLNR
jgi:hypothetical protein